ncbi:MAG: multicopper oxidase family protein [Myxococcales bacterium]|nr:multicopper oxidase family protein [Myxococcales bacterium]
MTSGLLLVAASVCAEPNREPDGWADGVELAALEDLNPDPHILEVNLEAAVVTLPIWSLRPPTEVYAFNGSVPGPLIDLAAGDRLIVHFTNNLPEPTTIHWHGLRIANEMDGAPHHPRPPVLPGERFDYDFVVPDAGLFWYHPHVNSSAQVGYGLYGALRVRASDDSEAAAPEDEIVLVLSDIGIDEDGGLDDPASGGDLGTLFGREGNVILVNGRWLPSLKVRAGITQRWRLVNAARSRYFKLALPGTTFTRIGNDGGLLPGPLEEDELFLIPGQRADVLVTPDVANGTVQFLTWLPYDRGFGSSELRTEQLIMRLELTDDPPGAPTQASFSREIAPIDVSGATPVSMRLTEMMDADGRLVLGINDLPFAELEPWLATLGETQVWEVTNEMDWDHPFHLHGFFFQELGDDGEPLAPLSWQDSINVPSRETRRIAVVFDERPGMWMFHCHILDHADAGMMGMLHLTEP